MDKETSQEAGSVVHGRSDSDLENVLGVEVLRSGHVKVGSREEVRSKDVNLGVSSIIDILKA